MPEPRTTFRGNFKHKLYDILILVLYAVFGMGSAFLEHAMEDYATLKSYAEKIEKSLTLAESYLTIK